MPQDQWSSDALPRGTVKCTQLQLTPDLLPGPAITEVVLGPSDAVVAL